MSTALLPRLPMVVPPATAPSAAIRTKWRRAATRSARPVTVHATAEYEPFARTGGMAEAVAGLARVQAASGGRVFVFVPLYGAIAESGLSLEPFLPPHAVRMGNRWHAVRYVTTGVRAGAPTVVFVDADVFSRRRDIYGPPGSAYDDNHVRFALFASAVTNGVRALGEAEAIVHAHDWHAGLVPLMLADDSHVATVVSVHNAGYQGWYSSDAASEIGMSAALHTGAFAHGQLNFLLAAIRSADAVVTVSPSHADELRTPLGGFGFDSVFRDLGDRLSGVCNGIDESTWDPETDQHIVAQYSADDLSGKAACKADLQRAAGLPVRPDVPLFVTASRLVHQKGFDLVLSSERVRNADAQFVFLGQGERRYHHALADLARERPQNVAVEFDFSIEREHRLLAGADALLMPSLYEPCGLTQMRAQRYGALVVARRVGGLRDTVEDGRTGFVFDDYTPAAFDAALGRALACHSASDTWGAMVAMAMARRFGWERAARAYAAEYDAATRRRATRSASRAGQG